MTNSHRSDLEVALERLSRETWDRLRTIRAFSHRPMPYNLVRLGETTITDLAMMELCLLGLSRSIFLQTPQGKEVHRGTDFEWWLGSVALGWYRLGVQAKKLDMKTGRYLGLAHKTNQELQIDALERYALRNRVTPLYCLYNYSNSADMQRYWHCCLGPMESEQLGCTLTPASRVRQAIEKRGKRTFHFIHEFESTLPWRCMVACPKIRYSAAEETSSPPQDRFPLTDSISFYPELPAEFQTQSQVVGGGTSVSGGGTSVISSSIVGDSAFTDDARDYGIEVIQFDGSLPDYYDLEAGLPKSLFITDLHPR